MPLFSIDDQRLSESEVVEADNLRASFVVDDALTEAVRLIVDIGDEIKEHGDAADVLHDVLTAEHLALHLPKIAGWRRGYAQETTLETSPCHLLTGQDAVENPSGAFVHIEWLEMRKWQRRLPLGTESPGVHWCSDVILWWRPVEDQIIGRNGGITAALR